MIEFVPMNSPNCPDAGDGRNPLNYLAIRPENCVCDLVRFRSHHRNPGKKGQPCFSYIVWSRESFFFFFFLQTYRQHNFAGDKKIAISDFLDVFLRTLSSIRCAYSNFITEHFMIFNHFYIFISKTKIKIIQLNKNYVRVDVMLEKNPFNITWMFKSFSSSI